MKTPRPFTVLLLLVCITLATFLYFDHRVPRAHLPAAAAIPILPSIELTHFDLPSALFALTSVPQTSGWIADLEYDLPQTSGNPLPTLSIPAGTKLTDALSTMIAHFPAYTYSIDRTSKAIVAYPSALPDGQNQLGKPIRAHSFSTNNPFDALHTLFSQSPTFTGTPLYVFFFDTAPSSAVPIFPETSWRAAQPTPIVTGFIASIHSGTMRDGLVQLGRAMNCNWIAEHSATGGVVVIFQSFAESGIR